MKESRKKKYCCTRHGECRRILPAGMEAYLVYHVADGNMQILEEGEQRPEYNEDGSYNGALAKYQCLGM